MQIKLDPTIDYAATLLGDGTILVNPQCEDAAEALAQAIFSRGCQSSSPCPAHHSGLVPVVGWTEQQGSAYPPYHDHVHS